MDTREIMELVKIMPSPGCPFNCTLRTVEGNNLNLVVPNVKSFHFSKQQLRDFALENCLPTSLVKLMSAIESKEFSCPSQFFQAALTALSLGRGYGVINLEYPDTRAFIATVSLSYRVCMGTDKSI
ncbi:MAG: hypothetical protein NWQ28_08605 [Nodularia sp. (in: cyanobacteria)]|nr:hypothetical protein [Nodularia sp. (in: cyanobacteria)]